MANQLTRVLAQFVARVHNRKDRLVSIPAGVQRELRLVRQADNHLLLYSIRPKGERRWDHRWAQLTFDNEFSVPADVARIERRSLVEVKIHRLVKNIDALADKGAEAAGGAALLLELAAAGDDARIVSSSEIDDAL